MVKGTHLVRRKRDAAPDVFYLYAWRGGPRIKRTEGSPPKLDRADLQKLEAALAERDAQPRDRFRNLIRNYRASPAWQALAPSTQKLWQGELTRIEAKWGDSPITVWSDHRITAKIVAWRDSRADTPRAADEGVKVLKNLLEVARLQGFVASNYATKIPSIYKPEGRAEIIWTPEDVAQFTKVARKLNRPLVADAIRLGCYTGFRRADLAAVSFEHVSDTTISMTAAKKAKGRRRRAIIPIIEPLKELIEELRSRTRQPGVTTLLVNSKGQPWRPASLTQAVAQVCKQAGIVDPGDERLNIPPELKHLHDTRGTFVTYLCRKGIPDKEIASIVGWSEVNVDAIRKRYVDEAARNMALAKRIGEGPL